MIKKQNKVLKQIKFYTAEILYYIAKAIFNIARKIDLSVQELPKREEELEQMRRDFVSNVTHELKTPITSIKGFIETLKNGSIDNKVVARRFLDIIDIEAERLHLLINDILELSEIENGGEDANVEEVKISTVVDDIFEITQYIAAEKGIRLINKVDPNVIILANRNRMKQLFLNLIDNGIKYNVDNIGILIVDAEKTKNNIIISVKDTGIGMDKEHIPRIFERFYRIDKGRTRENGGTGLGLSIVKHIVHLYTGTIYVESEKGKGTQFIIKFPLNKRM